MSRPRQAHRPGKSARLATRTLDQAEIIAKTATRSGRHFCTEAETYYLDRLEREQRRLLRLSLAHDGTSSWQAAHQLLVVFEGCSLNRFAWCHFGTRMLWHHWHDPRMPRLPHSCAYDCKPTYDASRIKGLWVRTGWKGLVGVPLDGYEDALTGAISRGDIRKGKDKAT